MGLVSILFFTAWSSSPALAGASQSQNRTQFTQQELQSLHHILQDKLCSADASRFEKFLEKLRLKPSKARTLHQLEKNLAQGNPFLSAPLARDLKTILISTEERLHTAYAQQNAIQLKRELQEQVRFLSSLQIVPEQMDRSLFQIEQACVLLKHTIKTAQNDSLTRRSALRKLGLTPHQVDHVVGAENYLYSDLNEQVSAVVVKKLIESSSVMQSFHVDQPSSPASAKRAE
ncbi:MAG: hypothetical protein ACO3A2_07915 [Bdellovibrionia bacterium]